MKRSRFSLFKVLISLAIISVCPGDWPAKAATFEPLMLQPAWNHQFQFAGYYAALEMGFYDEAGLEVRLIEAGADINCDEDILAGKTDYCAATGRLIEGRVSNPAVCALHLGEGSPDFSWCV